MVVMLINSELYVSCFTTKNIDHKEIQLASDQADPIFLSPRPSPARKLKDKIAYEDNALLIGIGIIRHETGTTNFRLSE